MGVIWQTWRGTASERSAQISELIEEIKSLESNAVEYWTTDHQHPDNKKLEVTIRGSTFSIAGFESHIDAFFSGKSEEFREAIDNLIVLSTGGDFETSKRDSNFQIAIEIKQKASEVISLARVAKMRSGGMSNLFYSVSSVVKSVLFRFRNWLIPILVLVMASSSYYYLTDIKPTNECGPYPWCTDSLTVQAGTWDSKNLKIQNPIGEFTIPRFSECRTFGPYLLNGRLDITDNLDLLLLGKSQTLIKIPISENQLSVEKDQVLYKLHLPEKGNPYISVNCN